MCVDERRPRVRLDLLLRGPALLDCPQPLHDLLVEGLGAILHWDRLALPGQQNGSRNPRDPFQKATAMRGVHDAGVRPWPR